MAVAPAISSCPTLPARGPDGEAGVGGRRPVGYTPTMEPPDAIRQRLLSLTAEGTLARAAGPDAPARAVQCLACPHGCRIRDGEEGICRMRANRGGRLRVPHGYVAGLACDPIEKKPFFHFCPGETALSFGMLGCNLRCPFCQNWSTSQTLKDPAAAAPVRACRAEDIVRQARRHGSRILASTYNEPLITSEWAVEIFRLARREHMLTTFVSNGFASPEALDYIAPWLDAMNVDLKCFTEKGYQWLGGRLAPVLETIRRLWARGVWVEVITLVVPEFNDSVKELGAAAEFLASVSSDLPWHVTAYHAAYKFEGGVPFTPAARLAEAVAVGRKAGLRHVYAGNLRGLGEGESTLCHQCGRRLVAREGFAVVENVLRGGRCPDCGVAVAGRWG